MSSARLPRGRPQLMGQRLALSPMSWDDLPDLERLDADPEVMRHLGEVRTPEVVRSKVASWLSPSQDAMGLGFWVGHDLTRRGEPFVGWWLLTLEGPGMAEIGWRLLPAAWGRGLATEGARAVLAHGFGTVGLDLVIADTMTANTASRSVMHKLGMRHVRTVPWAEAHRLPGWEEGVVQYELSRAAWESRADDL